METVDDSEVVAYMGETAPEYYQGWVHVYRDVVGRSSLLIQVCCRVRKMFYHAIGDCHWTYYDHSNFLCFGQLKD